MGTIKKFINGRPIEEVQVEPSTYKKSKPSTYTPTPSRINTPPKKDGGCGCGK
jgi:hypothetical protein